MADKISYWRRDTFIPFVNDIIPFIPKMGFHSNILFILTIESKEHMGSRRNKIGTTSRVIVFFNPLTYFQCR